MSSGSPRGNGGREARRGREDQRHRVPAQQATRSFCCNVAIHGDKQLRPTFGLRGVQVSARRRRRVRSSSAQDHESPDPTAVHDFARIRPSWLMCRRTSRWCVRTMADTCARSEICPTVAASPRIFVAARGGWPPRVGVRIFVSCRRGVTSRFCATIHEVGWEGRGMPFSRHCSRFRGWKASLLRWETQPEDVGGRLVGIIAWEPITIVSARHQGTCRRVALVRIHTGHSQVHSITASSEVLTRMEDVVKETKGIFSYTLQPHFCHPLCPVFEPQKNESFLSVVAF